MTALRTCLRLALLACLPLMLATGANAAAVLCDAGPMDSDPGANGQGQQLSDLSYQGQVADNCYGKVSGNDSALGLNNAAASTGWGTGWALAARDNLGAGATDISHRAFGLQWTVSATEGSRGDWLLTAMDTNGGAFANLGDYFDFAVALKGGNGHALYLFDSVVFDGSEGGRYAVTFSNGGGQTAKLSHLSVYARYDRPGPSPSAQVQAVPEPGSLALTLSALLALVLPGALRGSGRRA